MSGDHNMYASGNQPAFPTVMLDKPEGGMTLRDYFAAKALQGMSADISDEVRAARWCYEMADAMIQARGESK